MSYTNEKQEEEHDSSYKSTSKTEDLQLFIDSSKDDMIFTSLNENADSAVSAGKLNYKFNQFELLYGIPVENYGNL